MEVMSTKAVSVAEPSQSGEARRIASNLAHEIGGEGDVGRVAIAVTEAATTTQRRSSRPLRTRQALLCNRE
jgi:hypothetical protein